MSCQAMIPDNKNTDIELVHQEKIAKGVRKKWGLELQ